MDLRCYLAMTAAEFQLAETLPPNVAWMACHFSSYGTGLSNLPSNLPPGSMLIVNDRTPIHGHNPAQILEQLQECTDRFALSGILLDFQRPDYPEAAQITQLLAKQPPCPVAVTPYYADGLSCSVFLPPPPLHIPLSRHIAPWSGREIWLETALENQEFTVTAEGSHYRMQPFCDLQDPCFSDHRLHCKYRIETSQDHAVFTLSRDPEMLATLLEEAGATDNITRLVGLYQQLQDKLPLADKNQLAI